MEVHSVIGLCAFVCLVVTSVDSVTGQYRGDRCLYENIFGRCKLLSKCSYAIAQLRASIRPQLCGFEGKEPVVCCPRMNQDVHHTPAPITVAPGTKSHQKCDEYAKVESKASTKPKFHTAVVGGIQASAKEFPHMAALGFGDENDIQWQCGGTLVSEEFVLTAAHCLYSQELGEVKWVRLGDLNLRSITDDAQPITLRVIAFFRHPQYTPPSRYNDIALVKLSQPVEFTDYIKPACLQTEFDLPEGYKPVATGWGRLGFAGETSDELMKVTLSYFSNEICRKIYSNIPQRQLPKGIVDEIQVCAGGIDESKDTCQGDSGGPLQIPNPKNLKQFCVIGVTSFGKACGVQNIPGVYTRVSNYISWIENIVWSDSH